MKAFDITVPPGFVRFDLPLADEVGLRRFVAAAAAVAPSRSMASIAGKMHSGVLSLFDHLAANGCFLVFMASPDSMLAPAQPMVSFRHMEIEVVDDPLAALLAVAAKDPTSELLDIEPAVCVRSSRCEDVDLKEALPRMRDEFDVVDADGRSEGLAIQRVQCAYTLGVPGDRDSWYQVVCVATLASLGDTRPEPNEVIEMFDSILSTFRWRDDA